MLLDTSAYSALAHGTQTIVEAVSSAHELKLPLPVIAELHRGFAKGSRREHNEQQLQRFLAQPQISVVMPTLKTTEHYATLQLFCQQQGRALSQNDIWIAALAHETGNTLVTFDKDFATLEKILGSNLLVLS